MAHLAAVLGTATGLLATAMARPFLVLLGPALVLLAAVESAVRRAPVSAVRAVRPLPAAAGAASGAMLGGLAVEVVLGPSAYGGSLVLLVASAVLGAGVATGHLCAAAGSAALVRFLGVAVGLLAVVTAVQLTVTLPLPAVGMVALAAMVAAGAAGTGRPGDAATAVACGAAAGVALASMLVLAPSAAWLAPGAAVLLGGGAAATTRILAGAGAGAGAAARG